MTNVLDYNILTIPGYKQTLDSWGWAGDFIGLFLDFFIGIGDNGNLKLGDFLLDIVSLASGA